MGLAGRLKQQNLGNTLHHDAWTACARPRVVSCLCMPSPAACLSPRRIMQQLYVHRPRGQLRGARWERAGIHGCNCSTSLG